jgi:hypothetical protein
LFVAADTDANLRDGFVDVAVLGQPFDHGDIVGLGIGLRGLVGVLGFAVGGRVSGGVLDQEVAGGGTVGRRRGDIEPLVFDEWKAHAAAQRLLGIGLKTGQLVGAGDSLLVQVAVLAEELRPVPQRRVRGQFMKALDLLAMLFFYLGGGSGRLSPFSLDRCVLDRLVRHEVR